MEAELTQTIVVSKCMEFRIKPTKEQKILIWTHLEDIRMQ